MEKKRTFEMLTCTGCGFCRTGCPVFERLGTETSSGKGKVLLAYGLLQGDIKADESIIRALQACSMCKYCQNTCPSLVDIPEIIYQSRQNLDLLPEHKTLRDRIQKSGNPYGKQLPHDQDNPASTFGYFPGCIPHLEETKIKEATLSVLKKLGIHPKIINEKCCNAPLHQIGIISPHPPRDLKDITTLIFSCPTCYYMFTKTLKKPPHLLHITEFLVSQKLQFKPLNKKIIYHDPCYLGRWMGIYDAPRQLLQSIPGVTLIEFKENRHLSQCCGGELEFRVAFPALAEQMGKKILQEVKDRKALLVTASPHCSSHLHALGGNPQDIMEIINKSLVTP